MPDGREVELALRRRQVAGVLILLGIIAGASIYRAGGFQVFPRGWWHIW
jgi:hypothetical protein